MIQANYLNWLLLLVLFFISCKHVPQNSSSSTSGLEANQTQLGLWQAHCRTKEVTAEKTSINVLPLIINPVLSDGTTARQFAKERGVVSDAYFVSDPLEELRNFIKFYKDLSCDYLNIRSVKPIYLPEFPMLNVGGDHKRYSPESWQSVVMRQTDYFRQEASSIGDHQDPAKLDYRLLFSDREICYRIKAENIDEVWAFAFPYAGFYESMFITDDLGPDGFYINGPTIKIDCPGLDRLVVVGTPDPHSFGHRAEYTIGAVFSIKPHKLLKPFRSNEISVPPTNSLKLFDVYLGSRATLGYKTAGCGSLHYTPNARCRKLHSDNTESNASFCLNGEESKTHEYDYDRLENVYTICDQFLKFPVRPERLRLKKISCCDWGCTEMGYYHWWWKHLPLASGTQPGGLLNNWWRYIFDPNFTLSELSRPGFSAPSDTFISGFSSLVHNEEFDGKLNLDPDDLDRCLLPTYIHNSRLEFEGSTYVQLALDFPLGEAEGDWLEDPTTCAERCNAWSSCSGFTVDRFTNRCQVKLKMLSPNESIPRDRYTSFLKLPTNLKNFEKAQVTHIFNETKVLCPNRLLNSSPISSVKDCGTMCEASKECSGIFYNNRSYQCYMADVFNFQSKSACNALKQAGATTTGQIDVFLIQEEMLLLPSLEKAEVISFEGTNYKFIDFDHPYNDIVDEVFPTVAGCLRRCNQLKNCKGIAKKKGETYCGLKQELIRVNPSDQKWFTLEKQKR